MTLHSAFEIASSGLTSNAARVKIHANNIANLGTPNYIRKIPVLTENTYQSFDEIVATMRNGIIQTGISYGPSGVNLSGVMADRTPGKRIYQPGHPEADKDGYINSSNVNVLVEMSDALQSSKLYEANLAVAGIVKAMSNKALEIGRGG